jgi:plastocyanin
VAVVAAGIIASVPAGDGAMVFIAPPAVIAALVAAVAWRRGGSIGLALAVLLGALFILAGGSELSIGGSLFDAFPRFVPVVFVTAGGVVMSLAAAASIVQRVRKVDRPRLRTSERGAVILMVLGLAGVAGASAVATVRVAEDVPLGRRLDAVPIRIGDDFFDPVRLRAEAGESVRLFLHNEGRDVHTVTIDELDVDRVLAPGRESLVSVRADRPGRYAYYCRVSGHEDQRGTFVAG